MLAFPLCDPGWCAYTLYTERCRLAFGIDGLATHKNIHQTPGAVLACSPLKLCVVSTYTWHIAHIQNGTNGAARGAEVVDPEGGTHTKKTGLEHENFLKTQRSTSTDRWNKGQKTQPISTGRGEWGRRKHMSPSSEETPGHTGQELIVSLDFFSLTVLRFVVAHRRPPDYATCTYSSHIYRRSTE